MAYSANTHHKCFENQEWNQFMSMGNGVYVWASMCLDIKVIIWRWGEESRINRSMLKLEPSSCSISYTITKPKRRSLLVSSGCFNESSVEWACAIRHGSFLILVSFKHFALCACVACTFSMVALRRYFVDIGHKDSICRLVYGFSVSDKRISSQHNTNAWCRRKHMYNRV